MAHELGHANWDVCRPPNYWSLVQQLEFLETCELPKDAPLLEGKLLEFADTDAVLLRSEVCGEGLLTMSAEERG